MKVEFRCPQFPIRKLYLTLRSFLLQDFDSHCSNPHIHQWSVMDLIRPYGKESDNQACDLPCQIGRLELVLGRCCRRNWKQGRSVEQVVFLDLESDPQRTWATGRWMRWPQPAGGQSWTCIRPTSFSCFCADFFFQLHSHTGPRCQTFWIFIKGKQHGIIWFGISNLNLISDTEAKIIILILIHHPTS